MFLTVLQHADESDDDQEVDLLHHHHFHGHCEGSYKVSWMETLLEGLVKSQRVFLQRVMCI